MSLQEVAACTEYQARREPDAKIAHRGKIIEYFEKRVMSWEFRLWYEASSLIQKQLFQLLLLLHLKDDGESFSCGNHH